jgi:hypothetical protein
MTSCINEAIERPLAALSSGLELLAKEATFGQIFDGMMSRITHNLVRNFQSAGSNDRIHEQTAALTDQDWLIINSVEKYLAAGQTLRRWWNEVFPTDRFAQRFDLQRVFNRADTSFGFFDSVQLDGQPIGIMGNYQELFYDQPRTPSSLGPTAAAWMREQIREFVLHYFMRVSDFRQPAVYTDSRGPAKSDWGALSWCRGQDIVREGFGFRQLYYKSRGTNEVGKFSAEEESAIVDLREIGKRYEWIVVRVRILNFKFTFKALGANALEFAIPLVEESYLVLTSDFVSCQDNPAPDLLGRYGFGYAFLKDPSQGLLAYGPGQFDAAIELINFEVGKDGDTHVKMIFVANRPKGVANVSIDPVDWSFRLADLFSFGLTSQLLSPVKKAMANLPTSFGTFDPVYATVSLANMLTANAAAQQFCISKEQVEKDFLAQHFTQHYTTIVGSLLTWRQIPNWLDAGALPDWIITGRSS